MHGDSTNLPLKFKLAAAVAYIDGINNIKHKRVGLEAFIVTP